MTLGSSSIRPVWASMMLLTAGPLLANGPMGGGSGPSSGGGGPMMPPDLSSIPMGASPGEQIPESPVGVPYPPSGPDRATTLIDQINSIGRASRERDRVEQSNRCEDDNLP
jgi:hypothetical protein